MRSTAECAVDRYVYNLLGATGLDFNCDPDGAYGLMQCDEGKCYCVDLRGVRLTANVFPLNQKEFLYKQREIYC